MATISYDNAHEHISPGEKKGVLEYGGWHFRVEDPLSRGASESAIVRLVKACFKETEISGRLPSGDGCDFLEQFSQRLFCPDCDDRCSLETPDTCPQRRHRRSKCPSLCRTLEAKDCEEGPKRKKKVPNLCFVRALIGLEDSGKKFDTVEGMIYYLSDGKNDIYTAFLLWLAMAYWVARNASCYDNKHLIELRCVYDRQFKDNPKGSSCGERIERDELLRAIVPVNGLAPDDVVKKAAELYIGTKHGEAGSLPHAKRNEVIDQLNKTQDHINKYLNEICNGNWGRVTP